MSQYLIQRGDTLSVLARRFGTNVGAILAANPKITNPDLIFAGTFLNVPGKGTPAPASAMSATPAPPPVSAPANRFDLKLLDDTDYDDAKTTYYATRAIALMDDLKSPAPTDISERNYLAWIYLRAVRRLGEPNDEHEQEAFDKFGITPPRLEGAPSSLALADAEHYMYMRFLLSSTGDSTASALPYLYQARKRVGDPQKLRTDPRFPVLPPSDHALRWGLKGYNDGMEDYRKGHSRSSGSMGSAWRANKGLIYGSYGKY